MFLSPHSSCAAGVRFEMELRPHSPAAGPPKGLFASSGTCRNLAHAAGAAFCASETTTNRRFAATVTQPSRNRQVARALRALRAQRAPNDGSIAAQNPVTSRHGDPSRRTLRRQRQERALMTAREFAHQYAEIA